MFTQHLAGSCLPRKGAWDCEHRLAEAKYPKSPYSWKLEDGTVNSEAEPEAGGDCHSEAEAGP